MNPEEVLRLTRQLESDRIERTVSIREDKLGPATPNPKKASYAKTFDLAPALGETIQSLTVDLFKWKYLSLAIDEETLQANGRSTEEQMAALRFFDLQHQCPTHAGLLLFGKNPLSRLPGAYIQYVKFDGEEIISNVLFEKVFSGPLVTELMNIDDFIRANIIKERPVRKDSFQEQVIRNYPYWAIRELMMNAIMHRNYESNAPIYVYEFKNRIEIVNPGGLFGEVNLQNFPFASDYRNIAVAESMKILGYVNRFNYGIRRASEELRKNGNGEPIFDFSLITKFKVTILIHPDW